MTKLTKAHIKARDECSSRLSAQSEKLTEAIDAFNAKMEEAWTELAAEVDTYNAVIDDANAWKQEIAQEIEDYCSDKSDKWQESDKAQTVQSWKEAFEEEFARVEIDQPEPLSSDCDDLADLLDQIPEGAE